MFIERWYKVFDESDDDCVCATAKTAIIAKDPPKTILAALFHRCE